MLNALYLVLLVGILAREIWRHLTARLLGVEIKRLVFMPFGFYADEMSSKRRLLFLSSGVLFSLFLGLLLLCLYQVIPSELLKSAAYVNLALAAIHLLPIHPLDCAQFLKALKHEESERPAALRRLELVCCIIIVVLLSLNDNFSTLLLFFLSVIPTFLYRTNEQTVIYTKDYQCGDAMQPIENIHPLQHNSTISAAINAALKIPQSLFAVQNDGDFIGVIERETLLGKATDPDDSYVAQLVERNLDSVTEKTPLKDAVEKLHQLGTPLLVKNAERVIGILTLAAVHEFIRVKEIQRIVHDSDNFIDEKF